jgi:adenosylhomocysteinase
MLKSERSIDSSVHDLTKSHTLNVLKKLTERHHQLKQRANAVLITHVMPTAESYIELINTIFPVSLIIAIPYSADVDTVQRLRSNGFNVFVPSSVTDTFVQAGPKIEEILKDSTTPLIVQEVGGYLAGFTEQFSTYPHFIGIVEDTNNGHWRYQQAGKHKVPVLSMALSPVKDIEDTVIGDSVVYSTERLFREEFHAVIQGLRTGVIGYGKIGTSTAIALKGREATVTVYDIDPAKCIRARFEGYRIAPIAQILAESDLVIGCTGKTSVREEEIPYIRHNAILVSASAKNEEFDLVAFESCCTLEKMSPIIWRYTQRDGRYFYVLNGGTPINFRDRSILGNILDLIYSELFLCMAMLVKEGSSIDLHHSPGKIHTEVTQTWLEIYEPSFCAFPDDKIWSFPASLTYSLTHSYHLQTASATQRIK